MLKSDHYGIEIDDYWAVVDNYNELKSDHYGIEINPHLMGNHTRQQVKIRPLWD